jgi:hypothetical protein
MFRYQREKEFKDSATSKWGWFTRCAEHHQFSGDLQSFFARPASQGRALKDEANWAIPAVLSKGESWNGSLLAIAIVVGLELVMLMVISCWGIRRLFFGSLGV